jgi:hypothetical protein
MIDNISLLASSKIWLAPTQILPEISWNIGGSWVQEFQLFKQKASLAIDYYHTQFQNQLLVDRDISLNAIQFNNLQGESYSNSLQSELSFSVIKNLNVRIAYKYLDVKATYAQKLQQQVMVPRHRGFLNVGYITRNKRWEYDATLSVFGESRLPTQDDNLNGDQFSTAYPLLNTQITHVYKKWDFYIGGENITNFKQQNAILDAENPFGSAFDATRIWAPVLGINIYLGFRYAIPQKKK